MLCLGPQEDEPEEEAEVEGCRLAGMPRWCSGYGLVGVTRCDAMRDRLSLVHASLKSALGCLDAGAALLLVWPGLPFHPLLPFVASHLRPFFARVAVFAPPDRESFEVYLLATEYEGHQVGENSAAVIDPDMPMEPEPRYPMFEFLTSRIRDSGVGDDAVAWTLTAPRLLREGQQKGPGSFDYLWATFAGKCAELAAELGVFSIRDALPEENPGLLTGAAAAQRLAREQKEAAAAKARGKGRKEPLSKDRAAASRRPAAPRGGSKSSVASAKSVAAVPRGRPGADGKRSDERGHPEAAPEADPEAPEASEEAGAPPGRASKKSPKRSASASRVREDSGIVQAPKGGLYSTISKPQLVHHDHSRSALAAGAKGQAKRASPRRGGSPGRGSQGPGSGGAGRQMPVSGAGKQAAERRPASAATRTRRPKSGTRAQAVRDESAAWWESREHLSQDA